MQTADLTISEREIANRRSDTRSVVGTLRMEGLTLDPEALDAMDRYDSGVITLEQMSAEMDAHGSGLLASLRSAKVRGAA